MILQQIMRMTARPSCLQDDTNSLWVRIYDQRTHKHHIITLIIMIRDVMEPWLLYSVLKAVGFKPLYHQETQQIFSSSVCLIYMRARKMPLTSTCLKAGL